jgi:hypothetical protein
MRRLCSVLGIVLAAVGTACLGSTAEGPQHEIPYAVIYGHIGAPTLTTNIGVLISAYSDSAQALAEASAGFDGSFSQPVDTGNDYVAVVPASAPGTYYLDVLATGQGHTGYISSLDTIRALRVRFDSVNGGPHDSIEVNDTLP